MDWKNLSIGLSRTKTGLATGFPNHEHIHPMASHAARGSQVRREWRPGVKRIDA